MAIVDSIIAYYKLDGNSNDSLGTYNGSDTDISYVAGKINNCASFNGTSGFIDPTDYRAVTSISVTAKEINPTGLTFKPDGTMFFVIGTTSDQVHAYTMSTSWDVTTATFTASSTAIAVKESSPQDFKFNDDGTKAYVLGDTGNDITYFTCAAYDITSLVYVGEFAIAEDTFPTGIYIKPDGTKFRVTGNTNDTVYQYSMTARDMSTASYDSVSFSVATEEATPTGIYFKDDGTKMYILGSTGDDISSYTLATPRVVSSASFDSLAYYIGVQEGTAQSVFFKPDGLRFYIVGTTQDTVYSYPMASTWAFYGPQTLSCWFKLAVDGTDNPYSQPLIVSNFIRLYVNGVTNIVYIRYDKGPTTTGLVTKGITLGTGDTSRHHAVGTYDGDKTITIYVDGVSGGSSTGTLPPYTNYYTATTTLTRIGRYYMSAGPVYNYFNGLIDEIGIRNRELSADEVKTLYLGGNGYTYPFDPVLTGISTITGVSTITF